MLVLSRNVGEVIHIGDDIQIMLVSVEHGKAKIGIDAPRSVAVYRDEVYAKVKGAEHGDKPATDCDR